MKTAAMKHFASQQVRGLSLVNQLIGTAMQPTVGKFALSRALLRLQVRTSKSGLCH
jgi:hypothetical protein